MRTFLTLFAACLILTGCSSTPPVTSTYLLRSSSYEATGELKQRGNLYLGAVTVADYIDQPGLVLENADGTIHTARHHKWAEPLRVSLRGYLATEISKEIGHQIGDGGHVGSARGRAIDISIKELHGDAEGNAVLMAQWSVGGKGKERQFQFSETTPLRGEGYEALVAAYQRLFDYFAKTIATEL